MTIVFIDGEANQKSLKTVGLGTEVDPYIMVLKLDTSSEPQEVTFNEAQEVKFGGTSWESKVYLGTGAVQRIIKNSPGKLMSFYVYNKTTTNQFFQFFDDVVEVVNGSAAKLSFLVRAGETLRMGTNELGQGFNFLNGIVIGFSSSEANHTASDYTKVSWVVSTK
jgi:hypothetical protein